MGNFNKSYVVREAENIIDRFNEIGRKRDKVKINELDSKCKKLKKRNIFWKISTSVFLILFLVAII